MQRKSRSSPYRPALLLPTLALMVAAASPLAAQDAAVDGFMSALSGDMDMVQQRLTSLAEAIPEESYDWRPAEGVRSVSEVLMHVASSSYMIPAVTGAAVPEETGIDISDFATVQAYQSRDVTKAEAIQSLTDSFEFMRGVLEGADAATMTAEYQLFGQPSSGYGVWLLVAGHMHEHLGQMIAYARSMGVAPPWSQ